MRTARLFTATLMATMVVAACGGDDEEPTGPSPQGTESTTLAEVPRGGVFRWGTTLMPPSLDPSQSSTDANVVYFTAVYESLIRADAEGELVPGLATEWSLSDDGLTFDLTLRDGVSFQDDTPVDADAVVANFAHYTGDESLLAPQLGVIDSVEAVDATHVRFHLNRPGGDLPEILRGYAGMMASPASIADGTISSQPVGAGPFRVTAVTDSAITYERWDGFWDAASVHLDGIEVHVMGDDTARLNALRSGQLDATFIRPNQAEEAEAAGLETTAGPRVFTYGLILNPAVDQLASGDVRLAISKAIDRPSIESFLYDDRCSPTAQLFPPEYWAYDDSIDDERYAGFDPTGAEELLSAAAPDGVTFRILIVPVTTYQRLGEVLKDQLSEVGVTAELEVLDPTDLAARVRAGDFEAVITPLYSANPDPAAFAARYYVTEPNGTEYLTPEIGEAISASLLTVDRDERAEAIGDISEAVLEAGTPTIPVCIPDVVFAHDPSVAGLSVPLLGNYDFREVVIQG